MIMGAYEWMVERGFKPAMFVPGWWSYNEDTVKIIKKLGLKLILYKDYLYLHDYQLMDYLKGRIDFT
jgi:predicted deacetylase